MTEAIVIAWLQFVGAVLAGVVVAVVLGSLLFAAWHTDADADDIEQ